MIYIRRALIFSVAVFVANCGLITEVSFEGGYERLRSTEERIELHKEYGYPPLRSSRTGRLITVGPIDWIIASLFEFSGTVIAFILSIIAFFLHGKIQSMHYGSRFFVDKPTASFLPFEISIVLLLAIINCILFCGD